MVARCGSWMRFSHDFPVEDIRLENPDYTHDTNANYREAITALQGCITTMFPDRMDILKLALCKKDGESLTEALICRTITSGVGYVILRGTPTWYINLKTKT